jgi:hypothetical protein
MKLKQTKLISIIAVLSLCQRYIMPQTSHRIGHLLMYGQSPTKVII